MVGTPTPVKEEVGERVAPPTRVATAGVEFGVAASALFPPELDRLCPNAFDRVVLPAEVPGRLAGFREVVFARWLRLLGTEVPVPLDFGRFEAIEAPEDKFDVEVDAVE